LVGAPFIDGAALSAALDRYELPAVQFRPVTFTPMFQKHAGQPCGGVQLHVTDREAFRPYLTGVALLRAVYALWPEAMQWRRRAYEFVADVPAIDLLAGSSALRTGIEAGAEVAQLADGWAADERAFIDEREAWLLYP
jgi:uncharacterized protein YbbC (DUF1343 family)